MNEVIKAVQDLEKIDPYFSNRIIHFENSYNTVMKFVVAIGKKEGTEDLTRNVTNNEASNVLTGVSLAGKVLLPVLITTPIDLVVIVTETKKIHKKEPSKLSEKLVPILEQYEEQTLEALGQVVA